MSLIPAPTSPLASFINGASNGLRNSGWSVINSFGMNYSQAGQATPITIYNSSTKSGVTTMLNEVPATTVGLIRLGFANYVGNAVPNGELPNYNDIYLHVGLYTSGGTSCTPCLFNGERIGMCSPGQIKWTDPVAFQVIANTPFDIKEFFGVASYPLLLPRSVVVGGGSTGAQPSSTDGLVQEDYAESSSSISHSNGFTGPAHWCILGFTGANPTKTVGILLDSIAAGTGDAGGYTGGLVGWPARAAAGVTGVNIQWPVASIRNAFGNFSRSGDTIANFITAGQHEIRMLQASYYSTILSNGGTNDLASSLATLKANVLLLAGLAASVGCNTFIQATLLPKTTSTDGWLTVTNQTVTGNEATRTGFNSWLRDATGTGFASQAAAAYGVSGTTLKSNTTFQFFDAAAAVEVNSSNVLTLNGGFWIAPVGASAVYSGSVTTASGPNWTDTALTAALNTYRGFGGVWLTGNNAGRGICITTHTASGSVQAQTGNGVNTVVGDTYAIYPVSPKGIPTIDGTHPTSYSHDLIAQSFNSGVLA